MPPQLAVRTLFQLIFEYVVTAGSGRWARSVQSVDDVVAQNVGVAENQYRNDSSSETQQEARQRAKPEVIFFGGTETTV